jgi:hypothetical protein
MANTRDAKTAYFKSSEACHYKCIKVER